MKQLALVLFLFLFFVSISSAACIDSDHGKAYYKLGKCTSDYGYPGTDSCRDWGMVREYYCMDNESCWFYDYPCHYRCENGTCVEPQNVYVVPVQYTQGVWVATQNERNNNIPPCIGEIKNSTQLTILAENGYEYTAWVTLAPEFTDPVWLNTWHMELKADDIPNSALSGNQFWVEIECNDLRIHCIERQYLQNQKVPENEKLPGFAYGNFSGKIQRLNNYCEEGVLTRHFCVDEYNVGVEKVECDLGCSGSHCAPAFDCYDPDRGKNFVWGSNVTFIRHGLFQQDYVKNYEDTCNDSLITEFFCTDKGYVNFTVQQCQYGCNGDSKCAASANSSNTTCENGNCTSRPCVGDDCGGDTAGGKGLVNLNASGCCLNPNTGACNYVETAVDCCPSQGYVSENGPSNQSECFAEWFFPFNGTEACVVMGQGGNNFGNWQLCNYGCCCERTPEGLVYGTQTQEINCYGRNKRWAPLNQILRCDTETCDSYLQDEQADIGHTVVTEPEEEVTRISEEVCAKKEFKLCLNRTDTDGNPVSYEPLSLPKGAVFASDTGCLEWTPKLSDIGWNLATFRVLNTHRRVFVGINVKSCCPKFEPIGAQEACAWVPYELCVKANPGEGLIYSAITLPGGATFNPISACLDWTPSGSQLGLSSVTFSVSNGECGDQAHVDIMVRDCNASSNHGANSALRGLIIGLVMSALVLLFGLAGPIASALGVGIWVGAAIIVGVVSAIGALLGWLFG